MITPLFLDTDDGRHFSPDARQTIKEACAVAEPEVRQHLPILPDEIELACQTGTLVIPETGEMGLSVSASRVGWTVDASRKGGVAATARTQLRFTLFHELHHLARGWVIYRDEPRTTFMEGVVSEGLAVVFERDVGGRSTPWGEYPDNVREWVDELLALPVTAPYYSWMIQHADGRRWIGYRAGTYIAEQAIRASGMSAAALVQVPTDEILKMAGIHSIK
ncbi:DUF2268 domain-containing putative Zn-dependent protease [Vreelandella zhanjiangensis]|uniref:DUF2268 domain-containing putative Zn-dependent protease n=1 Tax=Vreelandella zhanjiangensis TaxID=1121960 RepID=UPI000373441C|nr:DUF2268 domain-containing putative Zn-dependent protease [Halomonas zhanjiangensis]